MGTYYADYSGSAGTGDASSVANKGDRIDHRYLYPGDEYKIKGNPIQSLGTAVINKDRVNTTGYGYTLVGGTYVVFSTTTGQTYINAGSSTFGQGYATGDYLMIFYDNVTHSLPQPQIVGLYQITVTGTAANADTKIYLDGYTGGSAETGTGGYLYWVPVTTETIKLNTTGLTKHIASYGHRTGWQTAGTATCTYNQNTSSWISESEWMSVWGSDKIVIPSSQSVGKVAHWELPSTADLSGYQQVSFLIRANGARNYSTPDSLRLCTDVAGNTSVHTVPIELEKWRDNYWKAVVKDFGANLNSAIRSVALYRDASQSTECTYYIDNIIACKDSSNADSFTHKSKIGLNDSDKIWYDIDYIDGDRIVVKGMNSYRHNKIMYYGGGCGCKWSSSGNSVNVYRVEPFYCPTDMIPNSSTEEVDEVRTTGSPNSNNRYTISGGWDSTFSNQNCVTIFEGNGYGRGHQYWGKHYLTISDLHIRGWDVAMYVPSCNYLDIVSCGIGTCYDRGIYLSSCYGVRKFGWNYFLRSYNRGNVENISADTNAAKSDWYVGYSPRAGLKIDALSSPPSIGTRNLKMSRFEGWPVRDGCYFNTYYWETIEIDTVDFSHGQPNAQMNVYAYQTNNVKIGTLIAKNSGYAYFNNADVTIDRIEISSPTGGYFMGQDFENRDSLYFSNSTSTFLINGGFYDGVIENRESKAIKFDNVTHNGNANYLVESNYNNGAPVQFRNFGGVSGANRNYSRCHLLEPDTSVRHTASGYSLKATTTNSQYAADSLTLGSILVNGGSAVTISLWTYKSRASEAVEMFCDARPDMGLTSVQTVDNSSAGTSQWVQISKTFTPTSAGKIDIKVKFTNGNVNDTFYIDDFNVSQV
jgi:hypothetical protein